MLIYVILIFLASLPILCYLKNLYLQRRLRSDQKNVCVLVLGDIGRSPRMQYHAISFAREGFTVDVIGYPGSPPMREITENKLIRIHYLRSLPEMQNGIFSAYIYKILVFPCILTYYFSSVFYN